MMKLRRFYNGAQTLYFTHHFRHLQLYSSSTSNNPKFVDYLMETVGFSNKEALSASNKLAHSRQIRGTKNVNDFNFLQNADSVITYFNQLGIKKSQIRNTISSVPQVLLCNVDKTLKPKIEYFLNLGFSESEFFALVKNDPYLFFSGLNTKIIPAIQALKEILGCDNQINLLLKKSTHFFRRGCVPQTLLRNVALLRDYGIPVELIRKRIVLMPAPFFRNSDFLEDAVVRVEKTLGIPRDSSQFLFAICLLTSFKTEKLESKRQIYKSFGWTESEIVALCRRQPSCFAFSEAKIKKKLDFLMKELGYKPEYLTRNLLLLTCSLEKRIVPRHKVLVVLNEKGLVTYPLDKAIRLKEFEFVKKFVLPFKEIHEVYCKHVGLSLEMLTLKMLKQNSNAA
ncbi:unnamed protein product [Amaranthus hypochondriacus]